MSLMHQIECDDCGRAEFSVPPHMDIRECARRNGGWTFRPELLPNGDEFMLDICPECTTKQRRHEEKK